ncbi:MAG: hypothetical protein ACE5MM_03725 [Nitrospiraceae bacterium]
MRLRILTVAFAGVSLLATGCAVTAGASELPGLAALRGQADVAPDLASGPLRKLADKAEAEAPKLDIVQLEISDQGNLVVFVIVQAPDRDQSASSTEVDDLLRASVESVWAAAREYVPDAKRVSVVFMRVVLVNTLDKGPAMSGWLVGSVVTQMMEAATYLDGPRGERTSRAFWEGEAVFAFPMNEPYTGTPNHPLRFLEMQR